MPLQRAALYLLMQFEDVVCQCQQNGLTQDIRTPPRKKAAKSKGSLDLSKDTLCLDTAVHPQDDSFRALDPCKVLCTLSLKDLGNLQSLGSFLHWYLAVVAMDALLLSFAAVAVCTRVDGLFAHIPARTLCPARPRHNESPPLGALVDILRRKVVHVLPPPDVLLPFALLAHFVVVRLDVGGLSLFPQIQVVLLTLISCIGDEFPAPFSDVCMKILQKRDECPCICRVWVNTRPYDKGCLHAILQIICRL